MNFDSVSFRYRDGTVYHRYFTGNWDGSNMLPIPTWTTSTIAQEDFGVPQTEESEETYDFNYHLDDVFLVYTMYYIRKNSGCTEVDWDTISEQWNVETGLGRITWALRLRFDMLKQMYAEWTRFLRDYPDPHHPIHGDGWWTTTCPPKFEKFRDRLMHFDIAEFLAQIPTNFMG